MRQAQLRESTPTLLELTPHQEAALRRLGTQLASSRAWWGESGASETTEERSVIRVERNNDHRFSVTVLNMIGAISIEGLHLHILPKIPLPHFLHIIQRGAIDPRSGGDAQLQNDVSLAELLARWFVAEAEVLMRRGLRSEYLTRTEELSAVRGQVHLLETALLIQQGRPVAVCSFDDLAPDSPLNRLIKGAAREIARNPNLSARVRGRARLIRRSLEGVGNERPDDHQAMVDRLARDYASVVPLAKLVLLGFGVGIQCGDTNGKTFLLRTPELVETGIRKLIARALPETKVESGRLMLGTTRLSMNPDLVFDGGRAVGDVKYKLQDINWNRADLYQSLAFATAYRTRHALLIGFHQGSLPRSQALKVGDVNCHLITWDARAEVPEQVAQDGFISKVRAWHAAHVSAAEPAPSCAPSATSSKSLASHPAAAAQSRPCTR